MGSIAINRVNYDSPIQKAFLFLICLGRMDGFFYEEKIVFVFLIAIAGIGLLFNFSYGRPFYKEKIIFWQSALLFFFLISISWAYSREQAVTVWIAYLGRSIVMLYIFSYLFRSRNYYNASIIFVVATILVNIHFLVAFGVSGMLAARAETIYLGHGWNANALAMQSVVSCFLILNYICQKKGNALFKVAVLPFLFFFILLTGSKTAFFLLFGSMMLASFLRSHKKLFTLTIIVFFLLLLFFLIFHVPFLYEIIGERLEIMFNGLTTFDIEAGTSSNGSASDNIRMYMLVQGWMWFMESPILGHGIGNFQELFGEINGGKELYAHNNYMELMVDTGIVGTLLYYWLYVIIIWRSLKKHSRFFLSIASFMIVLMIAEFGHVSYLVFCVQFLLCLFMCSLDDKATNVAKCR